MLTPPDGWAIDKQASRQNKIQVMVPNGTSFATAEPLIYVEVFYHRDKQQTLAEFARGSNARWVAANAKGRSPSSVRSNAAMASRRLFASPSIIRTRRSRPMRSARSASIPTKTGNEFVLDVVMSGSSKEALERADAAYMSFLKAH